MAEFVHLLSSWQCIADLH